MEIPILGLDFARVLKVKTNGPPLQRKGKPHLKKPAERPQISLVCTQRKCRTGWPSMYAPPINQFTNPPNGPRCMEHGTQAAEACM